MKLFSQAGAAPLNRFAIYGDAVAEANCVRLWSRRAHCHLRVKNKGEVRRRRRKTQPTNRGRRMKNSTDEGGVGLYDELEVIRYFYLFIYFKIL